jgi:hypothetical protein
MGAGGESPGTETGTGTGTETGTGTGTETGTGRDADGGGFDWRVYIDGTLAGLTPLIPIPFLDLVFERVFRGRMAGSVAKARGRQLAPEVRERLARGHEEWLSLTGCLAVPLFIVKYILKRLWRKVIYIFAITDAARALSLYWHRAYLVDHMLQAGHLDVGADTDHAAEVFVRTLRESDTDSLIFLGRELIRSGHRWVRMLFTARRRGSATAAGTIAAFLAGHWDVIRETLGPVAHLYNALYVAPPRDPGDAQGL